MSANLEQLYARSPRGIRLGVETMQNALDRAGRPQLEVPVVHVAGTNGKGSTCAMLESALREAGMKVGLYTSPHLVCFSERIRVNGAPLPDDALDDSLAYALEHGPELSFFEAATLTAFQAFRTAKVDVTILEVGLGGRFDATNVETRKLACAITSIGLDHEEFLGHDLSSIAMEKAGILRAGVPCVVGPLPEPAHARITSIAAELGAPLSFPPPFAGSLALRGPHQHQNAGLAAALAAIVGIASDVAARGIAGATWPGRYERIGNVLLDGAHNPDGVAALATALRADHARPAVLLFGAVSDKPALEMLDVLRPLVDACVYVAPGGKAPFDPALLAERHAGVVAATVDEALAHARALAGPDGDVLIAGSLYLVGEARAALLGLASDPRIAM